MRVVAIVLLVGSAAFAQRGGISPARNSGFGNILYPGTGGPPGRMVYGGGTHADRLGATVSGFPPYTGSNGSGRRTVVVPYPVYGYGYYPPAQPEPNVIVVQQPAPPPAQVIINQNFTPDASLRPVVREYQTGSDGVQIYEVPSPNRGQETVETRPYLIALKDQTVYVAAAYWVEANILHYVTSRGTHNQVSFDLVDRELTMRLNKERNVGIQLP